MRFFFVTEFLPLLLECSAETILKGKIIGKFQTKYQFN